MAKDTPQTRWRARNPQADWAHYATRSAIRRGLLIKQPCQECGEQNSEAHHPDHRQPLYVVWLCRAHHKKVHSDLRKRGS